MSNPDPFETIAPALLDDVSGGAIGASIGDVAGLAKISDTMGPVGNVAGLASIANHSYTSAIFDMKQNSGTVAPIAPVASKSKI